jgi:stage II sporulation protein D
MQRLFKICILFFFVLSFIISSGTNQEKTNGISIRILYGNNINNLVITNLTGKWKVVSAGKEVMQLNWHEYLNLQVSEGKILIRSVGKTWGSFPKISLIPENGESILRLKSVTTDLPARRYSGKIELSVKDSLIHLIHFCELDEYVAGVVTSESGPGSVSEFYKSQAVICRTYAMGHLDRHLAEGFNLCDGVHCQVFNGISYSDEIERAAIATAGEVICDKGSGEYITASFHANCGGETARAGDVWSAPDKHLVAVNDPWCRKSSQANWKTEISVSAWKEYLLKNGFNLPDSVNNEYFAWSQKTRKVNYKIDKNSITLKRIRADFALRSTFFSISPKGESLLFEGRGYGHGVGFCQEGAMAMAAKGKKYREIINFYYKNVVLKKLED